MRFYYQIILIFNQLRCINTKKWFITGDSRVGRCKYLWQREAADSTAKLYFILSKTHPCVKSLWFFFYSNPAPACILWSCCHRSSFSQYFFSKFWNEEIKPRTSSSVLFFVESTRVRNSSTSFSLASIREIPSNRCDSTLLSLALAISRSFCVDWSALVSVAVVSAWRFSTEYRGSESDYA